MKGGTLMDWFDKFMDRLWTVVKIIIGCVIVVGAIGLALLSKMWWFLWS